MSDIFGPASLKGGQGRNGANGSSPYSSLPGSQRQKSVGNGKGSAEWSGGMHGGIRVSGFFTNGTLTDWNYFLIVRILLSRDPYPRVAMLPPPSQRIPGPV